MFLRNTSNGDLAQVMALTELTNPNTLNLTLRYQAGEEVGDPVHEKKSAVSFPSGEALPQCWLDPHYRIHF